MRPDRAKEMAEEKKAKKPRSVKKTGAGTGSQAEKQVKGRLALEYIAKVENLTASEEDINTEYQKIADAYNLEIEKVKASIDSAAIAADVVVGKAALFLRENAAISTAEEEAK